jgi:hypothetical protein
MLCFRELASEFFVVRPEQYDLDPRDWDLRLFGRPESTPGPKLSSMSLLWPAWASISSRQLVWALVEDSAIGSSLRDSPS